MNFDNFDKKFKSKLAQNTKKEVCKLKGYSNNRA